MVVSGRGDLRSEVLGLMFLLRELGFFFVTHTDDNKTQVPSFCQKKGPKSPKYFQLGSFFSAYRQCLSVRNVMGINSMRYPGDPNRPGIR